MLYLTFRSNKLESQRFKQKQINCQHELGTGPDADAEKIVNRHIKLLHRYNEAKDAAQILIGRLANLKETTVRQIHMDLDLPQGD
ncbi:hypothetical protein BT96DRAFT_994929 [Gymnopus androsaceus JB14]|uniref:Swi5-domain-containing protein n=1 Tax=Gymnopus androsaceus JB14 TaxID=1447944 RepID=A0A6A4HJR2_9AGAR|nr:hypothetical protein BT96DRAFT_994929 [Gymnopus androsaceus JB14]